LRTRIINNIVGNLLAACEELEDLAPDRLQEPEFLARVTERLPPRWHEWPQSERYAVIVSSVAAVYFDYPKDLRSRFYG
jgi:hypothetical protein